MHLSAVSALSPVETEGRFTKQVKVSYRYDSNFHEFQIYYNDNNYKYFVEEETLGSFSEDYVPLDSGSGYINTKL